MRPFPVHARAVERKDTVIVFLVAFFPSATEQLSGTFCFSRKSNRKYILVLSCVSAWHLLAEDSLLGSRRNNCLSLLRLGRDISLLGSGWVAGSPCTLGYDGVLDCVSAQHPPVRRNTRFRCRPLGLTAVPCVSTLRSALVWQVVLFPCDSLPPWLKKRYNSGSSFALHFKQEPHKNSALGGCLSPHVLGTFWASSQL